MAIGIAPVVESRDDWEYAVAEFAKVVLYAQRVARLHRFEHNAIQVELPELHIDYARGGGYLAMHLAGPVVPAVDGIYNTGLPLASKHFHGYCDAALEVFGYFSFVHTALFNKVTIIRLITAYR